MIARILKLPFWSVSIPSYSKWGKIDKKIQKDTAIVFYFSIFFAVFSFFSWWSVLIMLGFFFVNLIAFIIWLRIEAKKNGEEASKISKLLKAFLKKGFKNK
jgi:hypothetical protein